MSFKYVWFWALSLFIVSLANAGSVSLPLKTVKKPSSDLVSNSGVAIDVGQAAAMAQKGEDLSLLNPLDNKMWQNRVYPGVEEAPGAFPQGNNGVKFLSEEAALPFTYMSRVQSTENPQLFYRLSLSRYSHTALMRAALLRKLGYYLPSPKYYRNLRLYFASEEQKAEFLKNAQESMISDFDSRGWVTQDDKKNHSLVFADAVLEPAMAEYFDIHWGYAPDPNNPDQLPAVQRFSRYRAYRALILPFALVDVPESINRYSPKFGSVLSGHVVINHPSADSFGTCTYEDARWLARRLADFRYQDYVEIVKAGAFPEELEELVLAKLIYRANNAFELLNVKSNSNIPLPNLNMSSKSGLVKNGKVTQEFVPGYPQRFAHGDREAPFQDGDLQRYLGIQGKSIAIATILAHINDKLNFLKVSDLYKDRQNDMIDRITKHIKEKPLEPLYQKVEGWGGPVGGINLAATRHVTTGTYFGSSAAIQLVDNLSVAGNLGYFMTLDGVNDYVPVAGANIVVLRDYTHVRPLLSIAEGTKVSWGDLVIPKFMNKLSSVLGQKEVPGQDGKPPRQPLDAFLSDLREGEVFTITDSVALQAYAQVSSSLDTLMGITPLNFLNTISAGADGSRVILKQTSFMRTKEGVQVFIRAQNGKILGATLDVNYFINIMRIRGQISWNDIKSDVFVIDYNPEYAEMIDPSNSDSQFAKDFLNTRKDLGPALRSLFKSNDSELLYAKFPHKKFDVNHDLKTKELRSKFLAWRMNSFTEDHLLKIQYPRSPDAPELNPKDEEITLFANKKGELKGTDVLGFAFDWIEGIINKWASKSRVDMARNEDPNPANTPFGKAFWRMVTTEADLTVNGTQYPSIAVIQHVWGGWHLDKKAFFKLLDEVQGELRGTPVSRYRLIEPEAFAQVTAVDFYRLTAQLSILPGGLEKIKDLIRQEDAVGSKKPSNGFERFIGKINKALGKKDRPNEKEMFNELMEIMGNGDHKRGLKEFNDQCRRYQQSQPQMLDKAPERNKFDIWKNGNQYYCLMPWMTKLMDLSSSYPKTKKAQTQWMTEVLYTLEDKIPLPQLLKILGEDNYIFFVRINGFRAGDEDGDLEYFSNTLGDPKKNIEYANGLIQMFATKTRISPIELDRSQGSFR
ncbi:hypothetical protein [Bdellovibrio sp. HCB2-146]|uniref:hypothetical protein n=1 Tax=Bdellovibrio sp. HCB2-146 TaxID=3394362 RepID=UPI0039BD2A84